MSNIEKISKTLEAIEKPKYQIPKYGCGNLLIFFGFLILISSIINHGKESLAFIISMLILFGLVPIGVGLYLIYNAIISSRKYKKRLLEQMILDTARKYSGKVSPSLIASECKIPIEDANEILKEFTIKGYITTEVTEGGNIVYIFPDFIKKE